MTTADTRLTEPPKGDAIPDSYAINVTETDIHVWQFHITAAVQDGEWSFVETFDRGDGTRLDLNGALLPGPSDDEYWIYARSYDCKLGCN